MMATSAPILAYRARDAIKARALAAHLANAGIEAQVLGEFLHGAYAGIHAGGMNIAEVWVAAEDRPAAEPIIEQWRQEQSAQSTNAGASADEGRTQRPAKLQFSMAALLWLMTAIAILAAATGFGAITF